MKLEKSATLLKCSYPWSWNFDFTVGPWFTNMILSMILVTNGVDENPLKFSAYVDLMGKSDLVVIQVSLGLESWTKSGS